MVFGQEDDPSQEACWLTMTSLTLKAGFNVFINLVTHVGGGKMEESPLIMANCSMKLNAEMSKADPEDGDR